MSRTFAARVLSAVWPPAAAPRVGAVAPAAGELAPASLAVSGKGTKASCGSRSGFQVAGPGVKVDATLGPVLPSQPLATGRGRPAPVTRPGISGSVLWVRWASGWVRASAFRSGRRGSASRARRRGPERLICDGPTGVMRPRSGSGGIPRGTRRATALEPSEVS